MLLTRECDYGIRIVRALSCDTKKTIEIIAEEEHIPQKFAYKIIKKLAQSNLVRSVRGRTGGYHLNKPLNDFTLYDIVMAVDNERYIIDCLRPDFKCQFRDIPDNRCAVHTEILHIQDKVASALSAKTMDIILQRQDNIGDDTHV